MPNDTQPKAEDMKVVLEAVLARLQEIDADISSRGAFATNIIYGQMHGFDKPVFTDEVCLIRKALGLPDEIPLAKPVEMVAAVPHEDRFSMEL